MRLIDLMNKKLGRFTSELQDHHLEVIGEANLEVMLIAVSSLSVNSRLAFITGLGDQLQVYGNELLTVRDNVEAARRLEARSLDAAKGAEDLAKLLDRALVLDYLLKQAFSLDEMLQIYENLTQTPRGVIRGSRIKSDARLHGHLETDSGRSTPFGDRERGLYCGDWSTFLFATNPGTCLDAHEKAWEHN